MSEERVREEAEPGEESANDDSNDAEETASSIKQADALRDEVAEVYRQADEKRSGEVAYLAGGFSTRQGANNKGLPRQ